MPVNSDENQIQQDYNPSDESKERILKTMKRFELLKQHRASLLANPYDKSANARTIEQTWDYCDFVSLPHKYSHPEMQSWQSNDSYPIVMSKLDTALSILIAKNPEVEISSRQRNSESGEKILKGLYDISWEKGDGRQELTKFVYNGMKHGTSVGREFHRYRETEIDDIVDYEPDGKSKTEKKTIIKNDEPYFENLPIRDCYFDNRAKPFNRASMRDWFWVKEYDYSTFLNEFPKDKYPNARACKWSKKEKLDKADIEGDMGAPTIRLYFYENEEDNEYIITDGLVEVYHGPLVGDGLSCVIFLWKLRNDFSIYGLSVPEQLEGCKSMLDRLMNMTVNQIVLAIGGAGFYGGSGEIKQSDMILEPKLKKLRDAEKIVFPKIPEPSPIVFEMIESILGMADENTGITKALGGENVGKTLGEAVLNREAGLRRMSLPLANLEFALERHARIRVELIRKIYSRPQKSSVIVNALGEIIDQKLFEEYQKEKGGKEDKLSFIQKFAEDENSKAVYRNHYREERLPMEMNDDGSVDKSPNDNMMEIIPAGMRGAYDVKIRAMSTIPMSKVLEESKVLETFNLVAKLPFTDSYNSERNLLKSRGQEPEEWMKSEEDIIATQELAAMSPVPPGSPDGGAIVPPSQMGNEGPAGLGAKMAKSISI